MSESVRGLLLMEKVRNVDDTAVSMSMFIWQTPQQILHEIHYDRLMFMSSPHQLRKEIYIKCIA